MSQIAATLRADGWFTITLGVDRDVEVKYDSPVDISAAERELVQDSIDLAIQGPEPAVPFDWYGWAADQIAAALPIDSMELASDSQDVPEGIAN